MTAVDPYTVVGELLQSLGRDAYSGPVSGRQMGEAAVMAAGMLAALGVEPAVEGDATHPKVLRGLALLDRVRAQGGGDGDSHGR